MPHLILANTLATHDLYVANIRYQVRHYAILMQLAFGYLRSHKWLTNCNFTVHLGVGTVIAGKNSGALLSKTFCSLAQFNYFHLPNVVDFGFSHA